ncbi:TrkA-C domain-containing protein [Halogranum gelatinilyticum]|uniref:TrkA-C domain-containing protein n=1 Tax=Halogranum gelatinilyticum TaxID=660521 RepID=A0A1G9U7Z6_9EURY|nr:TrkA C-terminal domain-containing protein [Halogranum gelatinilyticum]SDM55933.1 TrkA-C domain-containing protein [Halogranum gelatinilyticum]
MSLLQTAVPIAQVVGSALGVVGVLLGYALAAAVAAGIVSLVFRWYFKEPASKGVAALIGVAVVVAALNFSELSSVIAGTEATIFELETVLTNVAAIGVAIGASLVGQRVGDAAATNVFAITGVKELEGEVSKVVRSVGRVSAVTLPDEIDDMDEHDTVSVEKKDEMAGKTLLFPRKLTVDELRDRLTTRLKDDYSVGYVDVELDADGEVTYLAVGSRMAGIGPTLTPGGAAVAVKADPANSASPGDVVQVWTDAETPERVLTAELRATAGDVATLAVDAADAAKLDPTKTYRLVTLPAEPQTDREFASLLRAAEETMGVVTVREGSPLVGKTLGDVKQTVAAVRSDGKTVEAMPPRSRELAAGDTLYVVARPEGLRKLEAEAQAQPSSAAVGE